MVENNRFLQLREGKIEIGSLEMQSLVADNHSSTCCGFVHKAYEF